MGLGFMNSGLVSNLKENVVGLCKCRGLSVSGELCKMMSECLRYTSVGNQCWQAYMEAPVKEGLCEWFVDNTDDSSTERCRLVVEIIES